MILLTKRVELLNKFNKAYKKLKREKLGNKFKIKLRLIL